MLSTYSRGNVTLSMDDHCGADKVTFAISREAPLLVKVGEQCIEIPIASGRNGCWQDSAHTRESSSKEQYHYRVRATANNRSRQTKRERQSPYRETPQLIALSRDAPITVRRASTPRGMPPPGITATRPAE